jgi:hypothetical protein
LAQKDAPFVAVIPARRTKERRDWANIVKKETLEGKDIIKMKRKEKTEAKRTRR